MNSPNPFQRVEGAAVADTAKLIAWYKSKPLYAGGIIGLIVGLVVEHFLKV